MKRFTETTKWNDPWFMELEPIHKLFWLYLVDNCDGAGVWKINRRLANCHLGHDVDLDKVAVAFGKRVVKLDEENWFLPPFIAFQYGTLSDDCKPHKPVLDAIRARGLERLLKGYPKAFQSLKEKDKEKERDKLSSSEGETEGKPFDMFWKAYPRKEAKGDAEKVWDRMKLNHILEEILVAIAWQKVSEGWTKDGGQWVPQPPAYLSKCRWKDEKYGTPIPTGLPEKPRQKSKLEQDVAKAKHMLSNLQTLPIAEIDKALEFLRTLSDSALAAYFTPNEKNTIERILT